MDQLPLDHRLTDLRSFARFGEEGVDLFMVDSTNAEVPEVRYPRTRDRPGLGSSFAGLQDRSLSLLLLRMFTFGRYQRSCIMATSVALVGRSMERNMRIAQEKGYLTVPEGSLSIPMRSPCFLPIRGIYMATGSQGEPMAAASRISQGSHRCQY